jgi:hypothetical protein
MPYQLEKGPYFAVTESMLDFGGSQRDRLELLKLMIRGTDPNQLPSLNSQSLNAGPMSDAAARFEHMNRHWFGRTQAKPGDPWEKQAPFDANYPKATGYWRQWYGDAEGIVAETFIRAVEVSLGIDHVDPNTTDLDSLVPTRCWPIEVFWRCPAPWLEGWVTWRHEAAGASRPPGTGIGDRLRQVLVGLADRFGSDSGPAHSCGHVTVHLHTPSHCGSVLLLSPIRPRPFNAIADYRDNPVSSAMDRGMWVIAHTQQIQHKFYGVTEPSPPGQFSLPMFGPFVESTGKIVTVQPNEPDGGVLANGRPYTP